jgi:hypothetical protein
MPDPLSAPAVAARLEARLGIDRFIGLLIDEVGRMALRADGNLNHRGFYEALGHARRRFNDGEVAE